MGNFPLSYLSCPILSKVPGVGFHPQGSLDAVWGAFPALLFPGDPAQRTAMGNRDPEEMPWESRQVRERLTATQGPKCSWGSHNLRIPSSGDGAPGPAEACGGGAGRQSAQAHGRKRAQGSAGAGGSGWEAPWRRLSAAASSGAAAAASSKRTRWAGRRPPAGGRCGVGSRPSGVVPASLL